MNGSRRDFVAGIISLSVPALAGTQAFGREKLKRSRPAKNNSEGVDNPTGAEAYQSDDLADAIGINTHLNFRNDIWGQTHAWREPLIDLGVRYHRTSLGALADAKADFMWLWTNGGLKGLILASRFNQVDGIGPVFNMREAETFVRFLWDEIGTNKLIGVEGPNEPNKPSVATSGWAWRVREHQQWLYSTVKYISNGTLPVVGPSVWRRIPEDYNALGDLSGMLDVANLHNYTGGRIPSLGIEGVPSKETTLLGVLNTAHSVAPGAPIWVTEYSHDASDDQAERSPWVVPHTVAAKYLLRGIALKFKSGAKRIFVYSLLDDAGTDEHYGLIANDASYDLTPRPTYYALKRFIARLSDHGPAHTPGSLGYTLSGDRKDVETLLLRKRNGTWVLLIWQEVSLWDRSNLSEIRPPPRSLTLSLPSASSVTAYEPSEKEDGVVLARNSDSVSLSVPGHIVMLEIKPPVS